MDKTTKIDALGKAIDKHPVNLHDQDHRDIWKALEIVKGIAKELNDKIEATNKDIQERWTEVVNQSERTSSLNQKIEAVAMNEQGLSDTMKLMHKNYPKITSMQLWALIMDGENVVETVEIESWRYLLVEKIDMVEHNEYAELEKEFGWEIIDISNWKYDVVVNLKTNTQWETATAKIRADLLFIKY